MTTTTGTPGHPGHHDVAFEDLLVTYSGHALHLPDQDAATVGLRTLCGIRKDLGRVGDVYVPDRYRTFPPCQR